MTNYENMWKKLKTYIEDYKDCNLDGKELFSIMDDCENGDFSFIEESPEDYAKYISWCRKEGVGPRVYQ